MARYHEEGKRKVSEGYYAGAEARHKQESEDGSMIREDKSAIANLPQNVMIKMYPKPDMALPEDLDDTIRGVDEQMRGDDSKRRENFKPKKV
jgi:hypothetical protein